MEDITVVDILNIVALDQQREVWTVVGCAAMALVGIVFVGWIVRNASLRVLEMIRRVGLLRALPIIALIVPAIIYGGSKKSVTIDNFKANECPDSVTYTWQEHTETGSAILAVQVQRRLIGATEDEAWENFGNQVPGGAAALTVEGFTLDKDYEYRVRYIFTSEDN